MPGNPSYQWCFDEYPWLRKLHDFNDPYIVIKKAAQLGFTEYAINRSLFTLDQLKRNVLYALPNERPDAMGFSKGRINPAAELSPHIEGLFSVSKSEGHKITKDGRNFYIRGANSPAGFRQIDVGLVVLDELDLMEEGMIGLALHRMDGQPEGQKQLIGLSTPSIDGKGIDKEYTDSTQESYYFPCPSCSRLITLTYPECLVITAESPTDPKVLNSYLCCPKCKKELPHKAKPEFLRDGDWHALFPDRLRRGFYINQLFSCRLTPGEIAEHALRGRYDLVAKTELYNSRLGLTFADDGAKITDETLNNLRGEHINGEAADNFFVTMGCDVGQDRHHVCIMGWKFRPGSRDILNSSKGRLLYFGTVETLGEAEELMKKWKPRMTVFDSQPDKQKTVALAKKWNGICYCCWYSLSKHTKDIQAKDEQSISVNRSFWLGKTFDLLQGKLIELPIDMNLEFRSHLMSTVKVYRASDDGNPYTEFSKRDSVNDHYLHALNYAVIALGKSAGGGTTEHY